MKKVNIYIGISSRYPRARKRIYGYVLECQIKRVNACSGEDLIIRTAEGFGEEDGTYNMVTLRAMCEALKRINQSCEINMYIDNKYIADMAQKNLTTWISHGFYKAAGEPIKNQKEWMELYQLMIKHLLTVKCESLLHS